MERWILAALDHDVQQREVFIQRSCPKSLQETVRSLLKGLNDSEPRSGHILNADTVERAMLHAFDELADDGAQYRSSMEFGAATIGSYRLIEELGRGGMGVVYLAAADGHNRDKQVALKILRKDLNKNDAFLRFRRERIILSSVESSHVPKLLDVGTAADGRPYYAMEYIDGTSLRDFIRVHDPPITVRLDLFELICAAVQDIHDSLIIHRDIKPSNIFVTDNSGSIDVVLLDFGIATVGPEVLSSENKPTMRSDPDSEASSILNLTQQSVAPHTPDFAAPEQRTGSSTSYPVDIFALGVLLRFLAPSADSIEEIVTKACDRHPEKRFKSAATLASAVRAVRSEL